METKEFIENIMKEVCEREHKTVDKVFYVGFLVCAWCLLVFEGLGW